jgi:hypothetical protein
MRLLFIPLLVLGTGSVVHDGWDSPALSLERGWLSRSEREDLGRGEVIAKVLDSEDRREVMTFGAFEVRASKARFLECVRDVDCLRHSPAVLGVRQLSTPPSSADLEGLNLDPRDIEALGRCRVGHCDLKLTARDIEGFRKRIRWASPHSSEEVLGLFRSTLAERLSAYGQLGNRGLARYGDKKYPQPTPERVEELLSRPWYALEQAPELLDYLKGFPQGRPPGAEDVFYWYKERFWRKTLIGLNHTVIYERDDDPWERVYVVSKLVYANHYYESSVELEVYVGRPGDPRACVLFLGRAEADVRPSGFTWLERLLIKRLVRGRLDERLDALKQRLDSRLAVGAPPD